MVRTLRAVVALLMGLATLCIALGAAKGPRVPSPSEMDRDLLEVTILQLQQLYAQHKYTVTQVVQWHLARIERYDGIYRAVETVMRAEALAEAAREDADA